MQASEWFNAEIGAGACVYVCVCVCEGGGYEAPRRKKKGDTMPPFSQGPFFLECPPVAFVTSSFHVTTRHLLLKFLNIF